MNLHRVGIFADVSNLYFCCKERFQKKINYEKLLSFCTNGDNCIISKAYGIHSTDSSSFKNALKNIGWATEFKSPKSFGDGTKKADCDLIMVMDVVRSIDLIDKIILCTADGDFAPLIDWAFEQGRSVLVVGCNISHELKDKTECIEITKELLE
jgi:uncharacterized LabA/DUF88 family protein